MNIIVERFNKIQSNISKLNNSKSPKIVAVSKTFSLDHIMPLIEYGHNHFGENKVQEAEAKWLQIKKKKKNLQLHMIGKLQSNKAKQAVKIFDYIHSLDSEKLAKKISEEQEKQNKTPKIFIQINLGKEVQKSGIVKENLLDFYKFTKDLNLNVIGLMCIPPFEEDSSKYFSQMSELNEMISLNELSMGMSADYLKAIKFSSSFVRIGIWFKQTFPFLINPIIGNRFRKQLDKRDS